ncbi:MAG: TOTE conflict system archaeo-eukaryotic primase domain-containing protein [Oscillospiraceae bacterium]
MDTLILNGLPDQNDRFIVDFLTKRLNGSYKIINFYYPDMFVDDMVINEYVKSCDAVIIISPIVFGTLSGEIIDFAAKYIGLTEKLCQKHGAAIIVDHNSSNDDRDNVGRIIKRIMDCLNTDENITYIVVNRENHAPIQQVANWINSKSDIEKADKVPDASVNKFSSPMEKIKLFRSLFKGRENIYALRWHNVKTGKSGYSPVCSNKWTPGVCNMQTVKCADCKYRSFAHLDDKAIHAHLSGKDKLCRDVIGIYPMLPDETTNLLVLDFDDGDWKSDAAAVRSVCKELGIPCCVERSRSGKGAHLWIFFEKSVSAALARKLGSGILTEAMKKCHTIGFSSYDRMFPNQDTMPSGGFGNLIALPLQKQAVIHGNSVFVDENFQTYPDQWAYLSCAEKISEETLKNLISKLCIKSELGELYSEESEQIEFEEVSGKMFPSSLNIIVSNMLFIDKNGISQNGLNRIKRLASFKNPEFYKAQAMRMSTYGKPRIISLADENEKYIMIPRGCRKSLDELLTENNCTASYEDKTEKGRSIDVKFNGELRNDQQAAVSALMKYDNGVIAATTAFGKTVTAIGLIAKRKVNTLILVHTQALLQQWKKALEQFLFINELLPDSPQKRGRKKQISAVGQLGGSKNTLAGIVDIAVIQSLYNDGEVKSIINNYGMIIVDECHHISAFSFESVLRAAKAKYVYGLTATPKRSDGHQPIIFMQCGPIRYSADAKAYAEKHSFKHILVPRFTKFRCSEADQKLTITDIYKGLTESEYRNKLIVNDVISAIQSGRTPIIISERMSHIRVLSEMLADSADNIIILSGQGTAKAKNELIQQIQNIPAAETLIILATGKYVGEGFDCPRLDTLFLAMPISWDGTLAQYAGRLHREYDGKSEVMIFDYVDINVPMLENMYKKRLRGYAKLGYAPREIVEDSFRTIYGNDYENDLYRDIAAAKKTVIAAGAYISSRSLNLLIRYAEQTMANGVKFRVITKKNNSVYNEKIERLLTFHGVDHTLKNKLNSSFVVIDGKTVWYSTDELFNYNTECCVLRIEDEVLAGELGEYPH